MAELRAVFITHHHVDHVADVGLICLQAWSQVKEKLQIFGPPPIETTVLKTMEIHQREIEERMAGELREDVRSKFSVHELNAAGAVFSDDNVRVRSCAVDHPPVTAYAYRFEVGEKSIVFSGDTALSKTLVDFADGADVLVHEAFDSIAIERAFAGYNLPGLVERIKRSHSSVEDAARVASKANAKTLVLSPLIPAHDIPDEQWRQAAAKEFGGEIVVAHDGLRLKVNSE